MCIDTQTHIQFFNEATMEGKKGKKQKLCQQIALHLVQICPFKNHNKLKRLYFLLQFTSKSIEQQYTQSYIQLCRVPYLTRHAAGPPGEQFGLGDRQPAAVPRELP
uniref:Uncharacterized protein n=1 Tax=Spongospora subterranea TaxID=70186 RepID=A0A0H5QWH4_9EUKA|eukprot:CRZ06270.1 hypothetical protein [Spongospora subterranea]